MSEHVSQTGHVYCRGERFRTYLDSETIASRVRELGAEISRDYADKRPILIGVLNGAFVFIADLMRSIDIDCEVDFLKLSSYGAEKVSSGDVRELKKIDAKLEGRHVIIVEDIVDTGQSMQFMLDRLEELNPASIATVTLLHKPDATQVDLPLDYIGFSIPNLFVLGYGLDYGQLGRNLADLYILDDGAEG
jgi:hypoxanthine phosphoribosyltransferase